MPESLFEKKQMLQCDLMKDSKLERIDFISKYAHRIDDLINTAQGTN